MPAAKVVRGAVDAYIDGWRTGDRETWLAGFTDDVVIVDPWGTPERHGREGAGALWDTAHQAPMTFDPVVHRVAVCADRAMLSFTMRSLAPGGGGVEVDITDIVTVADDGRISRIEAYWDNRCMRMISA